MQFIREHKKTSIIIIVVLAILLISVTYAKYIYNIIDNYILETKGFYFNSNVMSINNKQHNINNWDGVNSYTLLIDVSSKKNDSRYTTQDVAYDIECTCPDSVTCNLSKNSGTITEDAKTDSFQLTISPRHAFGEGERVDINIKATSTSPYKKTLTTTYHIGVLKSNFTYNIEDKVNSKYLILNLTNSVAYYEVETAFDGHQVGDIISFDDYLTLSDANKAKCFSAKIKLSFSPNDLIPDMTSFTYINKLQETTETLADGYNYVNSYKFNMDAMETQKIYFYKKDITQDYTYPVVNDTSIIGVNITLAE